MVYPFFHGVHGGSFASIPANLGPPCNPWFDMVPERIPTDKISVIVVMSDRVRPRSHNRHISFKDIKELRDLVNARLPQPRAGPGHASIATHCLENRRPIFEYRHRYEILVS